MDNLDKNPVRNSEKEELISKETSFEEALEALEKEVAVLESGKAGLDESMKAFKRGAKLAEYCRAKLDEAEKQIRILKKEADGTAYEEDFVHDSELKDSL